MPTFSKRSEQKLSTCHPDLQRIAREAIKLVDFTVLEGHRPKDLQDEAFQDGRSKAAWPDSPHNEMPSFAMDLAPCPIDWANRERFAYLAGIVMAVAHNLGIELVWGGHFKSLSDLPHFELKLKKSA